MSRQHKTFTIVECKNVETQKFQITPNLQVKSFSREDERCLTNDPTKVVMIVNCKNPLARNL